MTPLRILIHAIGSAGDVHPFVGIGRALQARGHEVFVITSGHFEHLVTSAGLGFRMLGTAEDFKQAQEDKDLWHPRKGFPTIVRRAMNPSYEPILTHARELQLPGKTVMLASSVALGTRNASELLGIPFATVHLAPSLFPSIYRQPVLHGMPFGQGAPRILKSLQWWIAAKVVDFHVLPGLNRFRKHLGLPPARDVLHDWWNSPDRVIALFPDWFAPPQPDWPPQTRQTGFPMFDESGMRPVPPGLLEFLHAGEPPVIFTPGSAMTGGHSFFEEAVEAMKLTGRRGILLSPFETSIPKDLPPNVRHFAYVSFGEILPRAAAMVYHGGVGTCAQTLRAGIPHLIQPMAHDQLDTLSRVRDLGVGDGLHPHQFKAARIAANLELLLDDPAVSRRAKEVAGKFDPAGWLCETCKLIEAMTTGSPAPLPPCVGCGREAATMIDGKAWCVDCFHECGSCCAGDE